MEKYGDEFASIISCTSRPPREGEVDGVNYHFLTSEQFAEKLMDGDMIEAVVFRDWCYGTSYDSLNPDKINIGVYNPQGVGILLDMEYDIDLYPIMVNCRDKTRLLRQLNRESDPDCKEIVRRFEADAEDFGNSVWDKINLPDNHPHSEIHNEAYSSLDFLASEVVGSIRRWADSIN
jgi:guanylate kinase